MPKLGKGLNKLFGSQEDEYDYDYDENENYDYDDEEDYQNDYKESYSKESSYKDQSYVNQNRNSSKVVNINATAKLQVVLFKPESFGSDTKAIADELINMNTVVLNLEGTEREQSRRILDFLSGCAYANNGQVKRVASSTFIIIPNNVDLTGDDLLDELESSGVYF